jgi:exopolysaccharide biosynthesis polyprenyl glycosylphosphotransferase
MMTLLKAVVGDVRVQTQPSLPLGRDQRIIKRTADLVIAISLLILTAPLMLLVAIAIRYDSPGTIWYKQERVGYRGRRFQVLKFRSMVQNAEKDGKAVWAAERDPRVTRVGRIIRLMRIDELPQLLNVIRGEMSMVGPRPERPVFVERLNQVIPGYDFRHTFKPGITGWAQVNYQYGSSIEDAKHKHEYDLYYIENWSIFFDLRILGMTLGVVMWRKGAR